MPFIREVSYYSYGEITKSVSKNKYILIIKVFIYFCFFLEKKLFQHNVIDVDAGSLLRRSVLLREAVP